MALLPICVVVLTKNEEEGLPATLSKLSSFEQVVVVDSASTDQTTAIAEAYGASVVQFEWSGTYPKKKQWALTNVPTAFDWILLLDADEFPSAELIRELAQVFAAPGPPRDVGAYDLQLSYYFAGKFLAHGHRVVKRSLLRRSATRFPDVRDEELPGITEVEGHYQPQTTLATRRLQGRLMHHDLDDVSSWFARHNRYSDWEARLRLDPLIRSQVAHHRSRNGRIFELVPWKPILFFGYGYFGRLGILDGRAGFDYHFALASYYWQIGFKVRELRRQASWQRAE